MEKINNNLVPHVTILLAVYNGEKYLAELLDSIINQNYANWTLVISDDKSTDGSCKIIEEYKNKYQRQIKVYSSGMRFGGACAHFRLHP